MSTDFNHLPVWLREKLSERRLTIDQLASRSKGRITRSTVYYWLDDKSRPSTANLKKVVDLLSKIPVWFEDKSCGEWQQEFRTVTLEEAAEQFSKRRVGRPAKPTEQM